MILQRLYELALRENMLDDPAFVEVPVKFAIEIGNDGKYLGINELIGDSPSPAKGKTPSNRGKLQPVPVPHGAPNAAGSARFFADILARVLPISFDLDDPEGATAAAELKKRSRSRDTFWKQIDQAADATDDPALRSIQAFGRQLGDVELVKSINADASSRNAAGADRCTFAWHDDLGATILERDAVKAFYRSYFETWSGGKKDAGPVGVCQITGEVVPLPTTHPMKIQGVPGGLPTGVSLVSFDKDAFQSYGLDGAANAGIGYRAADGYCRAVVALIQEKLHDNPPTRLRVGESLFLIWTRDPAPLAGYVVRSFSEPTDEAIARIKSSPKDQREHRHELRREKDLLGSVHAGESGATGAKEPNRLYCLALSGNAARAIVRDYLEIPLIDAAANIARWFEGLSIARVEAKGATSVSAAFPIWLLASATARTSEDVAPEIYPLLLSAALRGPEAALPDSILVACLRRNCAEASRIQFIPQRMALIKLFLLRRDQKVSESLDTSNKAPAYLCGRLLAVLQDIQLTALENVNADVVDKFYGNFSTTPSMVFGRLQQNARNHLRKIRTEKPFLYRILDERLANLIALMPAVPPGVLSPLEQATFALGYYHERHAEIKRRNENTQRSQERKAVAAAAESEAIINS
jgi:CRISPR-associated protein Csd1